MAVCQYSELRNGLLGIFRRRIAVRLGLFLLLGTALGQGMSGLNWATDALQFSAYIIDQQASFDRFAKTVLGKANTSSSTTKPTASMSAFKPSGNYLVLEAFVQGLSKDPQAQKSLRHMFKAGLDAFEMQAKEEGKPSNFALAFSYFVISNYSVATGKEVADAAVDGLWGQISLALASDPTFIKLSNPDKQKAYEFFVLLGTFPLILYADSEQKKDTQGMELAQKLGESNLKTLFGVPSSQIKLGEKGLAISKPTP